MKVSRVVPTASRVSVPQSPPGDSESALPSAVQFKLATWIGENFGQELCIPPKQGLVWTVGGLNAILENDLVPSHRHGGTTVTVTGTVGTNVTVESRSSLSC